MREVCLTIGRINNILPGDSYRMKNAIAVIEDSKTVIRGGTGHIVTVASYINNSDVIVKSMSEPLSRKYFSCSINDLEEIK